MVSVDALVGKKSCTRKEMESLIGTLQHACKVFKPGQSFLRRAIALLSVAKQPYHRIRLNNEFKSDMMWCWNGTSIIVTLDKVDISVASDASGSWGCEAWSESSCMVPTRMGRCCEGEKHLCEGADTYILIATAIWGGKTVRPLCDNRAAVIQILPRKGLDATVEVLVLF